MNFLFFIEISLNSIIIIFDFFQWRLWYCEKMMYIFFCEILEWAKWMDVNNFMCKMSLPIQELKPSQDTTFMIFQYIQLHLEPKLVIHYILEKT